ncbi:ATP-binding protein [Pseudoalteromonas ostreae]|nr:ATP-binding protein [Pseudoalteromonas ostreae]
MKANKSVVSSTTLVRWLTFFFGLLLVLAVLLFETHVKKDVLMQIDSEFSTTNLRLKEVVTSFISRAKSDISFLHSTPPISGLPRAHYNNGIDPYDGTTYTQWKERLETIFIGFMENNLNIEQLRIIAVTAAGEELIRVQRRGASVEAVADYSLQPKSGELYFLPSSQLEAKQIYLSPMSLNREFGEVTFPYKPMLRLSIPIYSEEGKRFAFLIMNVNANALIEKLTASVFDYSQLIISTSEGDFLYHPNEKYRFTRDLAPNITWDTLYEQPIRYQGLYLLDLKQKAGDQYYVCSDTVQMRPGKKFSYINLSTVISKQYIDTMISDKRLLTYGFLLVIIFFSVILLITSYRNTTRSQMLAEARRESSAIVDGSIDAIVGLNLKGELTSLNFSAERLLSTSRSLSIGRHTSELMLLQQLPIDTYIAGLESSKPQIHDERSVEVNGQCYFFAISVSPVFSEQLVINGLALIIRDISKEKEAEVKVKRLNSELESKVRNRTQDLAEAKDQAIKNSDIKSAFISNISHQLRSPLNGVIGTLNILKREELPEKSRRLISTMELNTANLSVLINDILDLSKIEAGKLTLNFKTFNPKYLIEGLVESSSIMAFDKELEVYLDTRGLNCQRAVSDPLRLTQIINNLIHNAIKFTERGFIKVKVDLEKIEDQKHKLIISVQDTGAGIEYSAQQHLFKAFNQADSSFNVGSGSTGLGLSICKKLCLMMGGDIKVRSVPNEGSTFSFEIVIDSVENTPKSKLYLSKKALVVNSNKEYQELLGQLICHEGGDVELSSFEDLADVTAEPYDIIFFDAQDNKNGELEQIIDDFMHHNSNAKIVVLHKPGSPLPKGISSKVTKISKPFTQSDLLRVIGLTLSKLDRLQLLTVEASENSDIPVQILEQIDGCSILIVDDNEINIAVAAGALDLLPIHIKTASNGEQAIEALKLSCLAKPIRCILMDCQMPILNGYQACEKIRAGDAGNEFINIPIIAMTANAMMGEKEKCLSVGMNDYISKPIQANEAQAKVIEWALSNYEKNVPPVTGILVEKEVLWDQSAALSRLLNKEALLIKICTMFIKTAPEKFKQLTEFVDDGNYEQVRQVAHSLKGLCGEISADKLRSVFAEIELQASKGQLDIEKEFSLLEKLLPVLLNDMNEWLEENNV